MEPIYLGLRTRTNLLVDELDEETMALFLFPNDSFTDLFFIKFLRSSANLSKISAFICPVDVNNDEISDDMFELSGEIKLDVIIFSLTGDLFFVSTSDTDLCDFLFPLMMSLFYITKIKSNFINVSL